MSLLLAKRPKILMARQIVLWPQLATDAAAGFSWSGSASSLFGGRYGANGVSASLRWLEWDNVCLSPGTWQVSVMATTATSYGILHVIFNGSDTGAQLDCYSGSTVNNVIISDTFTVAARTKAAFRISVDSKHASSSAYNLSVQQFCLTKISDGQDEGRSIDDLPWHYDVPPWAYESSSTTPTATIATTYPWGTRYATNPQDAHLDYKQFLPAGTYTLSVALEVANNRGIADVEIDGNSVGAIDGYNASTTYAVRTITGITVSTTRVHDLIFTLATQHGSSAGYRFHPLWIQFRRTA